MLGAQSLVNIYLVLSQKLKIDIQLKLTSPPGSKGTILVCLTTLDSLNELYVVGSLS